MTFRGLDVDYRRDPAARTDLVEATTAIATIPGRRPETVLRIAHLEIDQGELGIVDAAADPVYRLFLAELDVSVRRFSNARDAAPGEAELRDVYDRTQDRDDGILRQAYEGLLGGIAAVLENRSRDTVATETDISGPIEHPETSTLQVVLGLIRHAFLRAILPGLERRAAE